MAYKKYFFKTTSELDNADDVARWLTEELDGYFDSITVDRQYYDLPLVVCTIGETEVLKFAASSPDTGNNYANLTTLVVQTSQGGVKTEASVPYSSDAFKYVKYGISTAGGIMLYMSDYYAVFIVKSNAGTPSVYIKWRKSGTSQQCCYQAADLVTSSEVDVTNCEDRVVASDITSLCPLVFPSGTYAPDLFLAAYSQYRGKTGMIYVDGTVYAYDGYVGLKC